MKQIVFSDVDGTLLNSQGQITPDTLAAIRNLQEKGIPFVINSGRGPGGIYPLLEEYNLRCPLAGYSGAVILDENRNVLFHRGIPKADAQKIVDFIEEKQLDTAWCFMSLEQWVVKDRSDPRVQEQEQLVKTQAQEGTIDSIVDPQVNKILCISHPDKLPQVHKALAEAFPQYIMVACADTLLEITDPSVTKGTAIKQLCFTWNIPLENTIAFGDHYNDVEMLKTAGKGFLMANAPEELKQQFSLHTRSNDEDGIAFALKQLEIL